MIESLSKEPFKEKVELEFRNEDNLIVVKDLMVMQSFYDLSKNRTYVGPQMILKIHELL